MILCIETSTTICSVALCNRSQVIASKEDNSGKSHAALLTPFIEEVLNEASIKASELEAVVVSKGPGSYTGLRIGVSVAKGIAFGVSIPLIGIETTLSMFHGFVAQHDSKYNFKDSDIFCPLIDARRMEVYCTTFSYNGEPLSAIHPEIITPDSFSNIGKDSRIFLFGDGAKKCSSIFPERFIIEDDYTVAACSMATAAYSRLSSGSFEDVAYFEPFYLKDFIATKPVKNLLR